MHETPDVLIWTGDVDRRPDYVYIHTEIIGAEGKCARKPGQYQAIRANLPENAINIKVSGQIDLIINGYTAAPPTTVSDKTSNTGASALRWLVFLPAAFIASMVVYSLVFYLNQLLPFEQWLAGTVLGRVILTAMASAASAAALVWVGATIAPSWKYRVAIGLVVIYVIEVVFLIVAPPFLGEAGDPSLLEIVSMSVAGGIAAYEASQEFKPYGV